MKLFHELSRVLVGRESVDVAVGTLDLMWWGVKPQRAQEETKNNVVQRPGQIQRKLY